MKNKLKFILRLFFSWIIAFFQRKFAKFRYYPFSPRLKIWFIESYEEKNVSHGDLIVDNNFALFPARLYKTIAKIEKIKKYNFCFIGALEIDPETKKNREWLIGFIYKNFSKESYLQFTDKKTKVNYKSKGSFDFTLKEKGFVPKEVEIGKRNFFDENYFQILCQSEFTLCPGGDLPYSMRFHEAIMCKSIPIVSSIIETYRSKAESELDYKFYLIDDELLYREDWTEHNYNVFLKYHTLEYRQED